ncbi:MAG: hypothetical protein DRZ90_17130 [Spirochaetes bacterium]|nr:MAG: hypothetical protein DRZ90_17130 [Spirochaetota bacterium]
MELTPEYIMLIFTGFSMAFIISLIMMPLLIALSHKRQWLDDPNNRKIHSEPVSRLGGVGIFLSVLTSGALTPILVSGFLKTDLTLFRLLHPNILFILATILIFIVGVLDDFVELRSMYKLIGQILAAALVCFGGALISNVSIPFTGVELNLAWAAWPVTLLWIIGVTNAVNLIDGIDGLSATISLIAFIVYAIVFMFTGHAVLSLLSFIVAGGLVGYLYFNFPPAKLFMGDSGSLLLGFILAILPLVADPKSGTSLMMPITLLSIPILDVFFSIARRWRKGISFSNPDMEHLHHKLIAIGFENRTILTLISAVMVILAIPVLLFFVLPSEKVIPFILLAWILIGILFMVLHWVYHRKIDGR